MKSHNNYVSQLRPNRSLNPSHCGMRPKDRYFIFGL